jgi:hypothetical protein
MTTKPDRLRLREIDVERLVIREPRGGRVRMILETGPPRPGMELPDLASARLTLLDARGRPRIVAEVDAEGDARLFVGGPDSGPMVVVTPTAVDVWHEAGNIVAALRATDSGGTIELLDKDGRPRRRRRSRLR